MSTATLTNTLADASSRAIDKASDAFRACRVATADTLDATAKRVNAAGESVADAAHSAADSMHSTAKYVRKNDAREMVGDVETLIRRHPGKALLGAVILGFFAGRAFRRD